MKIAYISENKMFLYDNGNVKELPSERVQKYTETVRLINHSKEWKHTGTGAQFTGAVQYTDDTVNYMINGLAYDGRGLIYSVYLGGMGGLYRKPLNKDNAVEEHIYTNMHTNIGRISINGDRIAAEVNGHISVFDMTGDCCDITDGDSVESYPSWSGIDGKIYCVSKGIARSRDGALAEFSAGSVISIDLDANSMDEVCSADKTDCLIPQKDSRGHLYFISQPYRPVAKKTPLWKDILLFPIRIIKAIGGFLNAFSVIFGGEPLRDKGRGDVKTKNKSDRELFFEGRLIEAEKNERENASAGEKNPGLFPVDRKLVKLAPNGEETVIKRGIQDFIITENDEIICSNGREILLIGDEGEQVLIKAKFAHSICEIREEK